MRNLTKVLALVLSLAFVLTMLSSAVYVPAKDVDYSDFAELSAAGKKAVNTLTALGIVDGMPDNSFEGGRDVKRAEYAKMIDIAMTGKTGEDDFNGLATDEIEKFLDVNPAAWYSGYVYFAKLWGILAGYGNGLMKPENPVTGLEAAKMTLVALGYDPEIEGLEGEKGAGNKWKQYTIRLASKIGLLKDLEKEVIETAFDREATAILIYNALNTKVVVSYVDGKPVLGDKTLGQIAFGGIGQEYVDEAAAKKLGNDAKVVCYLDGVKVTALPEVYYFEKAIDLDGDGDIDEWYYLSYNGKFVESYKDGIYEVAAVNGNTLTLVGYGDVEVTDATGIAAGDWVKLTRAANAKNLVAKKLAVKSGVIVAYSDNSSSEVYTDAGLGTTTAGGEYTVKFADGTTAKFKMADLTKDADEAAYWEAIIGVGSAAVQNGIKLNYILDGDKIVTFFKGEETYWDGYAIVLGTSKATTLGMVSVRLYTDDNEVKDFWVASYNGNQIYNNILTWDTITNGIVNSLVKYEEIGNNQIYLYSADYANASSVYDNTLAMTFDTATGNWEAYDAPFAGAQNSVTYVWDNATVFVSYGKSYNFANAITGSDQNAPYVYVDVDTNVPAYQWRAYRVGEFQPATAAEVSLTYAAASEVVAATGLNNVNIIKAAAVQFNHTGDLFVLPGLPLRAAEKWGTVMGLTSVSKADGTYNYEVEILLPYSQYDVQKGNLVTTETIKLSNPGALSTFNVGDIYKFYMDEDGVARRFEVAATDASKGWVRTLPYADADASVAFGSNYLEIFNASYISMTKNNNGYALKVEYPNYVAATSTFVTVNQTLYITEATDIFFTKDLFTTDIKAGLEDAIAKADLSKIDLRDYHIYADINWTTGEVYAVWFEKNTGANETLVLKDVPLTTAYDADNEEATYTLGINGIYFKDGTDTITVDAKPYELKAPIGDGIVDVEAKQDAKGNWYIENVDAITGYTWTSYSGKAFAAADVKAQSDIWNQTGAPWTYDVYTPTTGATSNLCKSYNLIDGETEIVWYRENFDRTNLLGATTNADFMETLENAIPAINGNASGNIVNIVPTNAPLDFAPDGGKGAYDYEISYVMTKDGNTTDAFLIVLVDLEEVESTLITNTEYFPYCY